VDVVIQTHFHGKDGVIVIGHFCWLSRFVRFTIGFENLTVIFTFLSVNCHSGFTKSTTAFQSILYFLDTVSHILFQFFKTALSITFTSTSSSLLTISFSVNSRVLSSFQLEVYFNAGKIFTFSSTDVLFISLLNAKINLDFLYELSFGSHLSVFSNHSGIQLFGKLIHSQVSLFFAKVITCIHIKSFHEDVLGSSEVIGLVE
jgi:hypothetical protein